MFRVSNTGEFTSLHVFSGGSDGGLARIMSLTLGQAGECLWNVTSFMEERAGGSYSASSPERRRKQFFTTSYPGDGRTADRQRELTLDADG